MSESIPLAATIGLRNCSLPLSKRHSKKYFHSARVCLTDLVFADFWELESLLSHATRLKELILGDVQFYNPFAGRPADRPRECRAVLESLILDKSFPGLWMQMHKQSGSPQ
jgi:hypothetical protein